MENSKTTINDIYIPSVVTTKVLLHISEMGRAIRDKIENKLATKVSNKCIPEGYVKPNSVRLQQYSCGVINMSEYIEYYAIYECLVCYPVEGMVLKAVVKNVTKAGLHCDVIDSDGNIPIVVYVIREHNVTNKRFHMIKEGDVILVNVVGTRFELNDPHVSVIASLEEDGDEETADESVLEGDEDADIKEPGRNILGEGDAETDSIEREEEEGIDANYEETFVDEADNAADDGSDIEAEDDDDNESPRKE